MEKIIECIDKYCEHNNNIIKESGYEVYPVLCQVDPDPDFKGTLSPNPEVADSYIELIIVNDASTDGTLFKIKKELFNIFY